MPENVSAFTNDAGYITSADIPAIPEVPENVSAFNNDAGYLTNETDPTVSAWAKESEKPIYDYSEIQNTPEIPVVPENVSAFTNDAGYLTTEIDPTVPAWAKENEKPVYDYSEIQNTPEIPVVPENVSAFTNDAGYLTTENDPTVPAWAKENEKPIYDYSEIQNTPEIPVVPENVSAFNNDAGYLTFENDPTIPAWAKESEKPVYDYSEIQNTPEIPAIPDDVSAFTNDAGYITSADIPAIPEVPENVSAFTNDAGYITSDDIPAIPEIPENVSAFNNDAGYITSAEIPTTVSSFINDANYIDNEIDPTVPSWAKESEKPVYDYSEIQNTPEIPVIPENISAFTNDAGYLTELQALSISGDTVFLTGGSYVVLPEEKQSIADVAAKGNEVNTQLKNVTDPTEAQDAVTLSYLDAKIAELNAKIEQLQELMNIPTDTTMSNVPEGGTNGLFSVSVSNRVFFSNGNLQYQASTDTWRFAENQWDYIGNDNANISSTYSGWIDLFGWGTGNNPTNTSTILSDYATFVDWGNNPISNGGNQANKWHTLTKDEWSYLLFDRTTISGIRYAKAKVNGVIGVIILPDDWIVSYYTLNSINISGASFTDNIITSANWTNNFESHGAVFLPAAGKRNEASVSEVGSIGRYWSSSQFNSANAYGPYFDGDYLLAGGAGGYYYGNAVRLVQEESAQPVITTYSIGAVSNPSEGGAITGTGTYEQEQTCTLTATPATGYVFTNWTEDDAVVSTETTYSFTVDDNRNLVANFSLVSYSVNATSNPTSGGTITGTGTYEYGQTCTLTATPANGYEFSNWTENGEVVSTNATYSFNVSDNRSLVANFNSTIPTGAINGLFSVSSTKKVYFSKGNLQYQASTNTRRFAENQWDYMGSNNSNISSTYTGWIDLFGWGTGNNPANSSTSSSDYSSFTDWGTKPISNGGSQANQWRTLTYDEWRFLMFSRTTTSGIRFAKATVNGVKGVVILPNDWSASYYTLGSTNNASAAFTANTITSANWTSKLEVHGAVFLPAAGGRNSGTVLYCPGTRGYYWSTTPTTTTVGAYSLTFYDSNGSVLSMYSDYRDGGRSVRLVADSE